MQVEQLDCVFCTREKQPPILFETPSLYAMPDRYPLVPGHVLIIPKDYWPCYGAAPMPVLSELGHATGRVKEFLESQYGAPVLINETGKTGQTVHHAHLHISPVPDIKPLLREFATQPDVVTIDGWEDVHQRFMEQGQYYYVEADGRRFLAESYHSPAIDMLRRGLAKRLDVCVTYRGLARSAHRAEVQDLVTRWRRWEAAV